MCCMRRQSRRLEECHNLMVGGGEKGTEKEWTLLQNTREDKVPEASILARIISGAFPLKTRKMPIVSLFFFRIGENRIYLKSNILHRQRVGSSQKVREAPLSLLTFFLEF